MDINIPESEIDGVMKILVLGNSNVGKTSLLSQYVHHDYNTVYGNTIGVDLNFKIIKHGNTDKIFKLQLWDGTGIERFRNIVRCYYKGTDGFIIMYDITNRKSFEDIDEWMNELSSQNLNPHVKILIGNKTDLKDTNREVLYEEGKEIAEKYNIDFFEVSAKNNINIENMFDTFIKNIRLKRTYQDKKIKSPKFNSSWWCCCLSSR
jgi:small GTP-binding protein